MFKTRNLLSSDLLVRHVRMYDMNHIEGTISLRKSGYSTSSFDILIHNILIFKYMYNRGLRYYNVYIYYNVGPGTTPIRYPRSFSMSMSHHIIHVLVTPCNYSRSKCAIAHCTVYTVRYEDVKMRQSTTLPGNIIYFEKTDSEYNVYSRYNA